MYPAKNPLFFLLVIFLLLLLVSACNGIGIDRYDEGPFMSLKTAEQRARNNWKWTFYEENGTNLSGVYIDSTLSIEDNNVVKIIGADEGFREGSWDLISKNKKLQLIFGTQARAYTILMLKDKEMWLSLNDSVEGFTQEWQLKEE